MATSTSPTLVRELETLQKDERARARPRPHWSAQMLDEPVEVVCTTVFISLCSVVAALFMSGMFSFWYEAIATGAFQSSVFDPRFVAGLQSSWRVSVPLIVLLSFGGTALIYAATGTVVELSQDGLRRLADLIRDNPSLASHLDPEDLEYYRTLDGLDGLLADLEYAATARERDPLRAALDDARSADVARLLT